MGFEPKSDNHAIVEVVFGLTFARNFTSTQIEALAKAHPRWRDELPRLNRSSFVQFMLGDGAPPAEIQVPAPVGGIMFDRIKPDGNLEWRLRVDERSIYVNCLSYTRWSEVWDRARRYFAMAAEIAVSADNPVTGILLQYIDVFEWAGDIGKYRVDALLNPASPLIVKSVLDKGHLWHLHQGWYRGNDLPTDGRLLERIHIDGVEDGAGIPTVKVDTYMQLQMANFLPIDRLLGQEAWVDHVYDVLHNQSKALLTNLLTKQMTERIGLHAVA